MKRGARGKDEVEQFNHPTNSLLVLRWANTALSNRLDNCRRELRVLRASQTGSETFIDAFFAGWRQLLTKLQETPTPTEHSRTAAREFNRLLASYEKTMQAASIPTSSKSRGDGKELDEENNLSVRIEEFLGAFQKLFVSLTKPDNLLVTTTLMQSDAIVALNEQSANVAMLKEQLSEQRDIIEMLSMRIRQTMDYSAIAVAAKTGSPPVDLSNFLERFESSHSKRNSHKSVPAAAAVSSSIEIEEQVDGCGQTESSIFECICGGQQAEYFHEKLVDALDRIVGKQKPLQAPTSLAVQASSDPATHSQINAPSMNINLKDTNSSSANSLHNQGGKIEATQQSNDVVGGGSVGGCVTVRNTISSTSFPQISGNSLDVSEEVQLLRKQKEKLISEKAEMEKVLSSMELELSNLDERFFSSRVYASLAVQTEELAKTCGKMKQQNREAKDKIVEIERLRHSEVSEILSRSFEERSAVTRSIHDAKETALECQLSEAIDTVLQQHFNFKKYTQPLELQITQLTESIDLQRKTCQEFKAQNISLLKQHEELKQKYNTACDNLAESTERIARISSVVAAGQLVTSPIDFLKYEKHRDMLKLLEKIFSDASSNGNSRSSSVNVSNTDQVIAGIRELAGYLKSREEKLKFNETEREKLQATIDEIWKEYESLDASFAVLKKASDSQIAQIKAQNDMQQELETKNLELIMKENKEHASYKALLAVEATKTEAARVSMNATKEQNQLCLAQFVESKQILEEFKGIYGTLKLEADECFTQLKEAQTMRSLVEKKLEDLTKSHAENLTDLERTRMRLRDAYDVLEHSENKQKLQKDTSQRLSNTTTNKAALTPEQLQINHMTSLLSCQCGDRVKDVILSKCLHPFCRTCIEKQVRLRQRSCPKCRTPFGTNDVKTLYLSN